MNNTTLQDQQAGKKNFLAGPMGWAIAAALGAAVGLLFAPKRGEELQEDVRKKAQELADRFNKSKEEVQKVVQNVFGEVSEEIEKALSKNYLEIRGDILAQAQELKDQDQKLTQDTYNQIVDESVKRFAEGKEWAQKSIDKLKKELKNDWNELKKDFI